MVSLEDVIESIDNAYDLFKEYVTQNEDYFNMSDIAEILNETFKELQEIIKSDNDSDYTDNRPDDLC
jgi:hypothetical protein